MSTRIFLEVKKGFFDTKTDYINMDHITKIYDLEKENATVMLISFSAVQTLTKESTQILRKNIQR